ncbi:response regulator [Methyloradius palustris]|uniref:DNA-binding response regulator n=1 Tax=Methyloradius palustris TaxID=2778876 RepID=A0A8D5G5R6_9PROT|nr:response regulator transcription factor [Methyloradius palustris]BCM26190.1 DNA-binding response regulator [Methyloradius palustris]
MIRLLIVDDHELMREGLKQLFEKSDDIIVAAEAATGEALLAYLQQDHFDLIMLDVSLPGVNSFELAQIIAANSQYPPILVLSMHDDIQSARRMFKAGAKGYITKNSNPAELIRAVHKVALGGKYIGSEVSEQMFFSQKMMTSENPQIVLTTRELSVLKLLVQGKKVTEIAHQFDLSVKTISAHKINIKQKLSIDNDADLIRYGINNLT